MEKSEEKEPNEMAEEFFNSYFMFYTEGQKYKTSSDDILGI